MQIGNLSIFSDNNLVNYLPLNGNNTDTKGGSSNTDANITYSSTNAKYGQRAGFNGTSSSINLGAFGSNSGSNPFTVCGWFYTGTGSSQILWGAGDNTAGGAVGAFVGIGTSTANKLRFAFSGGAGAIESSASVNDSTLHHFVATYAGGSSGATELWLDGISQGTSTVTAAINATQAFLGKRNDDTWWFNGNLDDVAYFNRKLTNTEIANLYYGINPPQFDLNDKTANGNNLTSINGVTEFLFQNYASLISYWKLENVNDSKGANNLTNSGAAAFVSGKYSNCVDLERGSVDYLYITDASQSGLDFASDFTISLWVNFESLPASGETYWIVGKWNTTGNQRSYRFGLRNNAGTYQLVCGISDNGTNDSEFASNWTPSTGTWYHVAVRYIAVSSGNGQFYVDGVATGANHDVANYAPFNSTATFFIGTHDGSAVTFDGKIDDVAIFSRALTAAEVAAIYNSGVELGSSYHAPFAASTNGANLIAASSQYLSAADSASLSLSGSLTIECWVKLLSLPSTSNYFAFVTKWRDDIADRGYEFSLFNNSGTYQFEFGISANGTNTSFGLVNWTPTVGVWYHIAVVYDAGVPDIKFYVDGAQQGSTQSASLSSIFNNAASLGIGAFISSPVRYYADALFDEVRIWNTARTQPQIDANKAVELTGGESGLVAYWPLEALTAALASTRGSYAFFM